MSDNATNLKGLLYRLEKLDAAAKEAASEFHNDKAVPKDHLKTKTKEREISD